MRGFDIDAIRIHASLLSVWFARPARMEEEARVTRRNKHHSVGGKQRSSQSWVTHRSSPRIILFRPRIATRGPDVYSHQAIRVPDFVEARRGQRQHRRFLEHASGGGPLGLRVHVPMHIHIYIYIMYIYMFWIVGTRVLKLVYRSPFRPFLSHASPDLEPLAALYAEVRG